MAINTGLGTSTNQPIQARLTKVSGNLVGVSTQNSGPQLGAEGPRYSPTKYTTENLAYPMDVEQDPRQGHYIFFNINIQDKAKVAKQKFASDMRHHERMIEAEYQKHLESRIAEKDAGIDFESPDRTKEEIKKEYISEHLIENYKMQAALNNPGGVGGIGTTAGRKDSSSLQLQSPSTTRIKTAIALYMPPSVQVSYAAQYNDAEIGIMADIGAGLIQAYKEGADAKKMIGDVMDKGGAGVKKLALGMMEAFAPGSKAMAQVISGRAITPKMELMFTGLGRREFSHWYLTR